MALKLGIEVLRDCDFAQIGGRKIALLSNPASVDIDLKSSHDIFLRAHGRGIFELKSLFGPQQGFFEPQQANMIEWEGDLESRWSIPLYSLYGKTRKPDPDMLKDIDCFIVDLQDVGAKGYTFISTLYYVMEACEEAGIEVTVLDRPNPLGGTHEGPVTQEKFRSFVGIHNLPIRHGLTMAETARLFKKEIFPSINLETIKMKGYERDFFFEHYRREWIPTSPNIPFMTTVLVYPGMELLEGTSLSEGRGTTRPFEQAGAPFIDPFEFCATLNLKKIPGVYFRPISFAPTFDKFKNETCYGAFIHVKDRKKFSSVVCALEIIETALKLYPDKVYFLPPPYEYEYEKMPFDILIGNDYAREHIEKGGNTANMEKRWRPDLNHYKRRISDILLY